MQHYRQLRRKVPAIIQPGEQPRDLAHLLADLERRQTPSPESDNDAASQPGGPESVSSDSTGDGSSSTSSSAPSAKPPARGTPTPSAGRVPALPVKSPTAPPIAAPLAQPTRNPPAAVVPPVQNSPSNSTRGSRGAIMVPVPGSNPTTLMTSTTRAALPTPVVPRPSVPAPSVPAPPVPTPPTQTSAVPTNPPVQAPPLVTPSPSSSSMTSQQFPVLSSSLVPLPEQPALSLPLPIPASSPALATGSAVATSVIDATVTPSTTPTPSAVVAPANPAGETSIISGGSSAGILGGSIAGVACLAGGAIYLYKRYRKSREVEELEIQVGIEQKPDGGPSINNMDGMPGFGAPPAPGSNSLDRMTRLDSKQYAAYRNLMGAGR